LIKEYKDTVLLKYEGGFLRNSIMNLNYM